MKPVLLRVNQVMRVRTRRDPASSAESIGVIEQALKLGHTVHLMLFSQRPGREEVFISEMPDWLNDLMKVNPDKFFMYEGEEVEVVTACLCALGRSDALMDERDRFNLQEIADSLGVIYDSDRSRFDKVYKEDDHLETGYGSRSGIK